MCKKLTTEEINLRLIDRDIRLVSEYKDNSKLKHEFQCNYGHLHKIRVDQIFNIKRCSYCTKENIIKEALKEKKIKLVDNIENLYKIDYKKKYTFECSKGHIWEGFITNIVHQKTGCLICKLDNQKLTTEEIQERLYKKGDGIRLNEEYKGELKNKHQFLCKNGHIFTSTVENQLKKVINCMECVGHYTQLTNEIINEKLLKQNRGIKILEDYKGNCEKKHNFQCSKGHIWTARVNNVIRDFGTKCPQCSIHGFNPNNPAYLYVYHLKNEDNKEVLGFGITNDIKQRNKDHQKTFRDNNIQNKILIIFQFDIGYKVLELENKLKTLPYNIKFDINGFKRENLPISFKYYINSLALQYGGVI